jgi:hypothetical protein
MKFATLINEVADLRAASLPDWHKVLTGINIIYATLLASPFVGLAFGLLALSLFDLSTANLVRMDARSLREMVFVIGLSIISMFIAGVGGILLGLTRCCQVPAGFRGKGWIQASFVMMLVSATLLVSCVSPVAIGFWSEELAARVPRWLSWAWREGFFLVCAGLAIVCALLFVRAATEDLGEPELAQRVWRRVIVFGTWLAGLLILPHLVEFLRHEVPWLEAVQAGWTFIWGPAVALYCVPVIEGLRRTITRVAASWRPGEQSGG